MAQDQGKQTTDAMEWRTYALPVSFALVVVGVSAAYGHVDLLQIVLLVLASITLQLVNNLARSYGDRLDRRDARNAYYERKFAQFKKVGKRLDPVAGTAGDLGLTQQAAMLAAACAMFMVLSVVFTLTGFGTTSWSGQWLAMVAWALVLMMVVLRYLGMWKYGYRVYGEAIVFLLVFLCAMLSLYAMMGGMVIAVIYPCAGVASLAMAASNLGNMQRQNSDADLSDTDYKRKTVPLGAGVNGAKMLGIAAVVLGIIWLGAFPLAMGSTNARSYAFLLLSIPLLMSLWRLRNSTPSTVPALRSSFYGSMVLLCASFASSSMVLFIATMA